MSRTRQYSTDGSQTCKIQTSTDGGNVWSTYSTPTVKGLTAQSSWMQDEITPRFRSRMAAGEVIMNPMHSMSSEISRNGVYGYRVRKVLNSNGSVVSDFSARAIDGYYTAQFRYPRLMMPEMTSTNRDIELGLYGLSDVVAVEQLALADVLERATGSDAAALVTIAELDKTVELMSSCVNSLNGMCKILESLGAQRRKFSEVLRQMGKLRKKALIKQFLKTLDKGLSHAASSWLGYRYGVMATIYDLESWIDASRVGPKRLRFVVKRASEWHSVPDWTVVANWQGDVKFGPMNYRVERHRQTITTAGVLAGVEALTSADRFGANRVASAVWELIPFSFVVDWIADTGTRLAAHEGSLLNKPLGSWITHDHMLRFARPYYWSPQSINDGTHTFVSTGNDAGSVVEVCRYRVRIPNPTLSWVPQLDVNLNFKRLTDSAALVTVLSKRMRTLAYARI